MAGSRPIRGLLWWSSVVLRTASLLAPKDKRKAWLEKKRAEVWHWLNFLYESGRLNSASKREFARHLWLVYPDALWLRFNREKVLRFIRVAPRSPRFCLVSLTVLLIVVVIASGFVPTIRGAFSSLPYKDPHGLLQLSLGNRFVRYASDTFFLTTERWARQSKTTESLAAYSWEPARMTTALGRQELNSARVSPNFFDVVGVNAELGHVFHPGDEEQCPYCIVISNRLWERGFHRDPHIVGRQVSFQGTTSTIIGVLPERFWFISREISVWTSSRSHARAFNEADRTGAALRLRPGASLAEVQAEFNQLVQDSAVALNNAYAEIGPIKDKALQGVQIYLLFAFVALIVSMAILAVRVARSISPKLRIEFRENYRWWLFFAAKAILLIAICFVASLEGPRRTLLILTGSIPSYAGAISSWFLLVTTVLAITWSLHDQYRRCRSCLKRLEHESYVGVPARLFLDWWGTELVCSQGHGLLHVPEMKASWMEEDQWIQLDESWKSLFDSEQANVS